MYLIAPDHLVGEQHNSNSTSESRGYDGESMSFLPNLSRNVFSELQTSLTNEPVRRTSTAATIPIDVLVRHFLADRMVKLLVLFKRSLSQLLLALSQVPIERTNKLHTPHSAQ
jgi:hypothetical protein